MSTAPRRRQGKRQHVLQSRKIAKLLVAIVRMVIAAYVF
jgi:hypothetical protein